VIEQVLIVGLAAWRASALLVYEDGPFHVFERIRNAVGIPADGGPIEGFLPLLLSCIWCTSVWTAAAMWGLWYVHWAIPGAIAAMAVAPVVERFARE